MDVQEYTWGNKKKFFSWNDELYSKAGNAALKKRYSEWVGDTDISLPAVLVKISALAKGQFIIIIDEWDCPPRVDKDNKKLQKG